MRLLICTQSFDKNDRALGFFVGWTEELAKHFDLIRVICLSRGEATFPHNVAVYPLGKGEIGGPRLLKRLRYMARLVNLAWRLRGEYDAVFVHMNQEYLLAAGWLWALLRKDVHFWRNHYDGNALTDVAARFAKKVFYTSEHSYTAKFPQAVRMPVGVDISQYAQSASRTPRSILWYARVAPSKRLELFIEALALLRERGATFNASVYGSPLPEDASYYEAQKRRASELGLGLSVSFHAGLPHAEGAKVFGTHEIFVNTSRSGMYDKTIFEAAASHCIVLSSSKDMEKEMGPDFYFEDAETLASELHRILGTEPGALLKIGEEFTELARRNSLQKLGERLAEEITR